MSAKKNLALAGLLAILTIAVDQLTKQWALGALADGTRRDILGRLLGLELHFNPGAAFSFLTSSTWIFTIVAVAAVIAMPVLIVRTASKTWALTLGIVWGGAAGNLVDRIARAPGLGRGHVIDFIAYGNWFIGNVADIALVGGVAAMILYSAFGLEYLPRRRGSHVAEDETPQHPSSGSDTTDTPAAQHGASAEPEGSVDEETVAEETPNSKGAASPKDHSADA